jgi:hypothetical protein
MAADAKDRQRDFYRRWLNAGPNLASSRSSPQPGR